MINKVINWTVGSFFRTIGKLVALILIIVAVYFIGGCEVNAATFNIPPWAVQLCFNGTCSSWDEDYTVSYADSKGIRFYSVNLGTNYSYNLIKYGYPLDDKSGTFDLSFNIHLVQAMNQLLIPVTVNSVLCDGVINGPYEDGYLKSAALLTYSCKDVPVSDSDYEIVINAPISYASTPTGNMYLWISKLELRDSQSSVLNDNIDDMEQSIIDSNKETQDTIKDELNECIENYNLTSEDFVQGNIGSNGSAITANHAIRIKTDFIKISNSNISLESSSNIQAYVFSYDKDKNFIKNFGWKTLPYDFTFDTNAEYVKIVTRYANDITITPEDIGNLKITLKTPICKNRLDNVSDSVNDLNDNINNSDITESGSAIEGFFSGFSSSDHGGISGIITAPLVAINKMLSGTCSSMTTIYKDKTISLPCGTDFWNKMGDLRDFYNLVVGGFLCYGMIIQLFKMIENLKNPDDDRVEVLDL